MLFIKLSKKLITKLNVFKIFPSDLMKFAEKMKMGKRFESISLGQGQGPLAENMMKIGCDFGNWVFFQVNEIRSRYIIILIIYTFI